MMEARENSSPRSSSCLMGQMLIVPQRGARIKSNHHLLREYCGPKMCLSPSVTGDYAPHKKLERDVHSLSGNQEMARECCLWNMSWCKSPRRWYNISPQKTHQPKVYFLESCLGLPGATASESLRDCANWLVCIQLLSLHPGLPHTNAAWCRAMKTGLWGTVAFDIQVLFPPTHLEKTQACLRAWS